jgi:uncharacterized membrane protein YgcG
MRKKLHDLILKRYFVRFHMSLIVAAVTMSGVLSSKLMLELGATSVLWRYPLAVGGSFLVFLLLVRVWIWYVAFPRRSSGVGLPDVGNVFDVPSGSGGTNAGTFSGFGGGDSGGGGASDAWGGAADTASGPGPGSGSSSWFSGMDLDVDLDDGWWVVLIFALLVLVIFGGAAYLIYFAPHILPDVAVQAVLASSLHGASKKMEQDGWVTSIVRSTCIPFLLVMVMSVALAYAIHSHCPGAVKMMDALSCGQG